jgi:hypothetical protein
MHRRRPALCTLTLGLLWAFTAGCYAFSESTPGALTPGATVRLTLDDAEALRQRSAQGSVVTTLSGDVLTMAADSVRLLVRGSGADGRELNRTLAIPRSAITRVEEKRFSPGRTAALAGVAAAAGVAALAINSGGTDPGGEPPPTSELVWSLLRMLLPGR